MAADPAVVVAGVPFVLVTEPRQAPAFLVAGGRQGPPGPPGVDGAAVDPEPNNQLQARPGGLYVPPHEWETNQW